MGRRKTLAVAIQSSQGALVAEPSPVFAGEAAMGQCMAWQRAHAGSWAGSLVLQAADYTSLPVEAPKVAPQEQRDAVRWQIKDQVEFAVEHASVDVMSIPGPLLGSMSDRLFAVAAPADRIAGWMSSYRQARCALDTIDIPEMAMRNLAALAAGDGAVAFLHVGINLTRMTLVWQRELCTYRQFELPAQQLLDAQGDDRTAMLDRLALDIQRTTDAFARQFHGADLSKLLLCAVVLGDEIQARLAEMTGLNVQLFQLQDHLTWPSDRPVHDFARDFDFTIAAGAALRPSAP